MDPTNPFIGKTKGGLWARLSRWEKIASVGASVATIGGVLVPAVHALHATTDPPHSLPPSPVVTTAGATLYQPQPGPTSPTPAAGPNQASYIAQVDNLCASWLPEFYAAAAQGGLRQRAAMAQTIRRLDDRWRSLPVPAADKAAVAAVLAPLERSAIELQSSQAQADSANLDDSNALAAQAQAEMGAFAQQARNYGALGCAQAGQRATAG
jgi:hypothetical protein